MPDPIKPTTTPLPRARVRMYRQGLGDCFLIRFPRPGGKHFHLVIDSGVIMGTQDPAGKMREVAEDIERETGGRIDALVVTHEHWDHVSGFTDAREVWERMQIAEAWVAWTEKPDDEQANRLRKDRAARKENIKKQIAALTGHSSLLLDATRGDRIDALLGFLGFSLGAAGDDVGGTKEALDYILSRAKKTVFYESGTSFIRKDIPGVRIYVLGPPRDEKLLKKSNPSTARPEVYSDPAQAFAFSGLGEIEEADSDMPFGPQEGTKADGNKAYDECFRQFFPKLAEEGADPAWRRLDFESMAELERLALALDDDTNNTSLALAFEFSDGRVMLFPADAQVGNWLSWQTYTWKVGQKSVRADNLLARTVLYKVGHHGSHNATLKDDGLEKMFHRDLLALVPVNKAMAVKKRWKMPFPPLYQRLLEKARGRVILADASEPLPQAAQMAKLTPSEQKKFGQMISASPRFIEFTL